VALVLECVVNISEGQRHDLVIEIAGAAGRHLLDLHADADHNRSVLTLAGPDAALDAAVQAVATAAIGALDLATHVGVHPRIGVLDVVPFADLAEPTSTSARAIGARDRFAARAGERLALPCFCYGPDLRTLPDIRRQAWSSLAPDTGPTRPHPTGGAAAVGARPVLVAYNLWLASPDVPAARAIARQLRGPAVRALAFALGGRAQVSFNLLDPLTVGPETIYDAVAAQAEVARAETVGLVPAAVLAPIPEARWPQLNLHPSRTIESRLLQAGLDGGELS
jgi:glutamate formiminotransferase